MENSIPMLRITVRAFYDAQTLRIEHQNRIRALIDEVTKPPEWWSHRMIMQAQRLNESEHELLLDTKKLLRQVDIWPWLKSVKGCGPTMAGVLICELIDPTRFDNVSKLWAFSGLHVVDGRAPRLQKGVKANWNSFLRAKMIGVLAPSFLKCNSPYRGFYDNYKTRLENMPCSLPPAKHKKGAEVEDMLPNGCTKGHMHNKAMRYMVKMFLIDFLVEWRKLRGLETRNLYAEQYLGHMHHGRPE